MAPKTKGETDDAGSALKRSYGINPFFIGVPTAAAQRPHRFATDHV